MSGHHNLRMHFPLKKVLNKLGDSYQTYINKYNMHAMATPHRGTGQPLEMDCNPRHRTYIDIPNDYPEDVDDLKNIEHKNHT